MNPVETMAKAMAEELGRRWDLLAEEHDDDLDKMDFREMARAALASLTRGREAAYEAAKPFFEMNRHLAGLDAAAPFIAAPLLAEIERLNALCQDWAKRGDQWHGELVTAEREATRLREGLKAHGHHLTLCGFSEFGPGVHRPEWVCTCGLDALLMGGNG